MDTETIKIFIDQIIEADGSFSMDNQGRFWKYRKGKMVRAEHRTPNGYLQLRKMVNGKRHHIGAHRMVYRIWIDYIPPGAVIHHKNGVKDDNRPTNLEATTYSKNQSHAHREGLRDQFGQKNPNARLSDKQVAEIRLAYSMGGYTQKELAEKYGVAHQTVSKIVRGDRRVKQGGRTNDYSGRRLHNNSIRDPSTGRFVKKSGRLLDDQLWNQYPARINAGGG